MDRSYLNYLRFRTLIDYGLTDNEIESYQYGNYASNNYFRKPVYCCEICNKTYGDIELGNVLHGNILHGTTSDDYFSYLNINPDSDWVDTTVMFVFENPGKSQDDDFVDMNGRKMIVTWPYIGWPTKSKAEDFIFETEISSQRRYGSMICAVLLKYKLRNAYVTNLVKCGFKDNKNLDSKKISSKIIDNCMNTIFREELKAISPDIIFAFGDKSYKTLLNYCDKLCLDSSKVVKMPHPARRMSNENRYKLLKSTFDSCLL